jgi:hypothetical protein
VTIEVLTAAELRGHSALRQLVEAVVAADEHDESDWVEWKGPLDLTAKPGCFHIARAVLGMANRDPERAATTCGGLSYVIAGAEPGQLHGLTTVDPARLGQLVELYLGSDGPAWTASYIEVDSRTVLVATVEAPKPGDRIHTLRREFADYPNGAIFIRRPGRTVRADAADLDMLQKRLLAFPVTNGANLGVRIIGDVPLSWLDPSSVEPSVQRWAEAQALPHLDAAREVVRRREASKKHPVAEHTGPLGTLAAAAAEHQRIRIMHRDLLGLESPDDRSFAEYEEEVTAWKSKLSSAAAQGLAARYAAGGHGVIRVEVENLGSRFLPDVEVSVHFGGETVKGSDEQPRWIDYPRAPHEFGKSRVRDNFAALSRLRVPSYPMPDIGVIHRRTWVEDGSIKVRWAVGDLRQHATVESDDVYVLLRERPADGILRGIWKATVPDVEGVLSGTVDVPVTDDPVDIGAVLSLRKKK